MAERTNERTNERLSPGRSRWPDSKIGKDGKFARKDLHMGTNKLAPGGTEKNTAWIGVDGGDGNEGATGTSIFDPTLCELVYRWFCFPRGRVLDPFAGGSVRGIVAALLGLFYTGVELSKGQIAANRKQAKEIVKAGANGWCGSPNLGRVQWVEGDAAKVESLARDKYDLIFSCPPYGNLEVYSEDPRDLSTMPHDAFLAAYRAIIAACVRMLKPERFKWLQIVSTT